LVDGITNVFSDKQQRQAAEHQELINALCQKIGQLAVERDFLKKNLSCSIEKKRTMIESQISSWQFL
jgi:hypothetical protein